MKKLLTVVAVAGLLSACGSTQPYATRADIYPTGPTPKQQQSAVDQAPEWMSKLPKSATSIYENGTATSGDFGMADMKAKTLAYAKICTAAGGRVRSQTKVYMNDNGTTTTESSEVAVRNICPDVDISGVETVEMKHVADGNRIRTYVLVALPIGANNIMKSGKETTRNAREAFHELDEITGNKPVTSVDDKTPVNKTEGAQITPVPDNKAVVTGTDSNGQKSTLKLLEVDNPEYLAKRDKCLKTPGCVIGQATLSDG
jgi:hypothetical protein